MSLHSADDLPSAQAQLRPGEVVRNGPKGSVATGLSLHYMYRRAATWPQLPVLADVRAAVDVDCRTVDVFCERRGEKRNDVRHLFGAADASERNLAFNL